MNVIALGTHCLYNSAHLWKTSPQLFFFFFLTSYCFGLGLHRASRFLHPGSAPFRSSGLLKGFIYFFCFYSYVHVSVCRVCAGGQGDQKRPWDHILPPPEPEVTSSCGLLDTGAGNPTQNRWKDSKFLGEAISPVSPSVFFSLIHNPCTYLWR